MTEAPQPPAGIVARTALVRASLVLAALALLGRIASFVREILFGALFGATGDTDAFYLAFSILTLVPMMLIGSVPQVFIAPYHEAEGRGRDEARRLFGGSLVLFFIVLGLVAGLVAWQAGALVQLLAPEFSPEAKELTVRCIRVLAPGLPLTGVSGVLVALARADARFVLAQSAPILVSVGSIVGLVIFHTEYGVVAAALGLTAGIAAQTAVIAAYPLLAGVIPRLDGDAIGAGSKIMTSALLLIVLNSGGGYLPVLLDRFYAAKLPEGAISCMGYALRLVAVPHMLVFQSLVIVMLTAVSNAAKTGDREETARLVSRALRLALLALLPVLTIAAVSAEPLVRLVYGRGAFDDKAVQLTAVLLACYVPSLVAETFRGTLVAGFFGLGFVHVSVILGAIRVATMALVFPFVWRPFGAAGLVLAVGAIDLLTVPLALVWAKRRLGMSFPWVLGYTLQLLIVSGLGAGAAHLTLQRLPGLLDGGMIGLTMALAAGGIVGGGVGLLTARALGIEEVSHLLRILHRRLGRGGPQDP